MGMKWDTANHLMEIGSCGHVIAINLLGVYPGAYLDHLFAVNDHYAICRHMRHL